MQHITEIRNRIDSIDEFFELEKSYAENNNTVVKVVESIQMPYSVEELVYTIDYGDDEDEDEDDNKCRYIPFIAKTRMQNIPYVLPDDSCVIYISNIRTSSTSVDDYSYNYAHRSYKHDFMPTSKDFVNGLFMIKNGDPEELYEIERISKRNLVESGEGKTYVLKKIDQDSEEYDIIRIKMITAIKAYYASNIITYSRRVSIIDDHIEYRNNSYYVGDHKRGHRHGYGIFVRDDDFVVVGLWGRNGFLVEGCISFYLNNERIMMSLVYDDFDNTNLIEIDLPIHTGMIPEATPKDENGKQEVSRQSNSILEVIYYDLIIVGNYLVFFDKFRIVNRNETKEEYKFTDDGYFVWLRIEFEKYVIMMDMRCKYCFVAGKENKLFYTFIIDTYRKYGYVNASFCFRNDGTSFKFDFNGYDAVTEDVELNAPDNKYKGCLGLLNMFQYCVSDNKLYINVYTIDNYIASDNPYKINYQTIFNIDPDLFKVINTINLASITIPSNILNYEIDKTLVPKLIKEPTVD